MVPVGSELFSDGGEQRCGVGAGRSCLLDELQYGGQQLRVLRWPRHPQQPCEEAHRLAASARRECVSPFREQHGEEHGLELLPVRCSAALKPASSQQRRLARREREPEQGLVVGRRQAWKVCAPRAVARPLLLERRLELLPAVRRRCGRKKLSQRGRCLLCDVRHDSWRRRSGRLRCEDRRGS